MGIRIVIQKMVNEGQGRDTFADAGSVDPDQPRRHRSRSSGHAAPLIKAQGVLFALAHAAAQDGARQRPAEVHNRAIERQDHGGASLSLGAIGATPTAASASSLKAVSAVSMRRR